MPSGSRASREDRDGDPDAGLMIPYPMLPALNAGLNSASFALLVAGYLAIRRRRIALHRACMIAALTTSTLFLISYLTYHAHAGTTRFVGPSAIRAVYLAILSSHTVLAAAIVPLVIVTLSRALRRRFPAHRKIARVTLPVWLYVSITGVVIYFMLYHLVG